MVHQNEMIHAAQDDLFQQLEAAQQDRLHDEVQRLGHHAKIATDAAASENTPLIVKAGRDVVSVDNDLDLEALDRTLQKREEAAAFEDQSKQPKEIASEELLAIFKLSVPLVGSQAIGVFPVILVGWMLGNVGGSDSAKILAASSLSDFIGGQVMFNIDGGLGSALSTVCTQSYGAKQFRQICLYGQAGVIGAGYCLIGLVLLYLNGAPLFKLLGQSDELAHLAGIFLAINALSLPFVFMYTVAGSLLTSQHILTPFVIIPVISNALTLPLAYALGFHSRLGYVGILLATVLNYVIKFSMMLHPLFKSPAFVEGWPGWRWKEAQALMATLVPLAFSSFLMVTFQTLGLNLISILCGFLPNATQSIAAGDIDGALFSLSIVPFLAMCGSGGIRVGTAIGAGKAQRAMIGVVVGTAMTVVVAVISAIASTSISGRFSESYTTNPETARLATALYPYFAVLMVLLGWMFGIQSALRACGKQWFIAKVNFVFLFVLGVPLGLLLAISLDLGIRGLLVGEMIGMLGSDVASTVYVYRLDWAGVVHEAYNNAHLHVEKEPEAEPSASSRVD